MARILTEHDLRNLSTNLQALSSDIATLQAAVDALADRATDLEEFDDLFSRDPVTFAQSLRVAGEYLDLRGGELRNTSRYPNFVKFQTHWDDLRVPITAVKLGGVNDPDFDAFLDDGLGSTGVKIYRFAPNLVEEVFFVAQMPHTWEEGTAIQPHVHWVPITNATGSVRWGFEYMKFNVNESAPQGTTILYTLDASDGEPDKHKAVVFDDIDMQGNKVSCMLLCRLFRDATDAADTYTGDAGLLEFDFHYRINSPGSTEQFTKTVAEPFGQPEIPTVEEGGIGGTRGDTPDIQAP